VPTWPSLLSAAYMALGRPSTSVRWHDAAWSAPTLTLLHDLLFEYVRMITGPLARHEVAEGPLVCVPPKLRRARFGVRPESNGPFVDYLVSLSAPYCFESP
jgi:hypothetical protein